jgi:DNA polymerase-3 subunit alpha
MEFVSLHSHTTYSFLDGYSTPDVHALRAAELGCDALAFTEHGNVSSLFRAEQACLKAGIKFIPGIEAYTQSAFAEPAQTKYHLTVLASNQEGYRNLNRAVTRSWQNYYYHPTMTGDDITEFRNGLIVLSGCSGSYMACTLIGGKGIAEPPKPNLAGCEVIADNMASLFPGRFYLEVQAFPELESCVKINTAYAELSRVTGIPLAATLDIHYPRPEDNEMQVILHACGPQGRGRATADEMLRRWNYEVLMTLPESDLVLQRKLMKTGLSRLQARDAISNTSVIASQCNVTLPKADRLRYPISDGDWKSW